MKKLKFISLENNFLLNDTFTFLCEYALPKNIRIDLDALILHVISNQFH